MKELSIERFAGIQNTLPPERVNSMPTPNTPSVDLVEAVNVDIDESGQLRRRAGSTLRVPGATHSLYANGELCLYVADGMMYRLAEDFTSTPVAGGLTDARMAYVEANGRIFHSNGAVTAVFDAGRVRSWGIPLNLADVSATATTGAMPAGVYQFAMTLLRGDGQESGCALAHRIDLLDNAGITFSWDVPADLSITDVALYVTMPDSETLLQAVVLDVELGSYTYTGGARSLPLATQWLDAPPAGSTLAAHKGRIYIGAGAFVYATAPLSYEHCDLRDFRAIDGSRINLIAAVEGGLFVGTEQGLYFMAGAAFTDNTLAHKMSARVVPGSLVMADGADVTGRTELAGQIVALLATADGIVMGMPDGSVKNFTRERFAMPQQQQGAAVFRLQPTPQYLLST